MRSMLVLFLMALGSSAQATLIDFDGAGVATYDASGNLAAYEEDGFALAISGSSDCGCAWSRITTGGLHPPEGDFLSVNGYEVTDFSLTISTSEAFTFNGLAISSNEHGWDPHEETLLSLYVEGFYVGGGSIVTHLDGFVQNVWRDFAFDGYTGLSSLVIRSQVAGLMRLDSIAMNSTQVPLPATLSLLVIALLGMFVNRRRGMTMPRSLIVGDTRA